MVIWLIGMSASGKTTIGKKLFEKLQGSSSPWFFLDGDTFRNIFNEDVGHTIEDRRKNAYRISNFCKYLNSQGINVLACVLSIFHDNQKYNREIITDYKEVFIDVDFEKIKERDNKHLYENALQGKIKNVVGIDIEFKPPYSPNLVINNNEDNPDYDSFASRIIKEFSLELSDVYIYSSENRLLRPHKYQYTRYEGKPFFEKYRKNRKENISCLSGKLEKLSQIKYQGELSKAPVVAYFSFSEPFSLLFSQEFSFDYSSDSNFLLKKHLFDLLNYMIEKKSISKKDQNDLFTLIKRFEVGKKLYREYDRTKVVKKSAEYEDLVNYPLFSLVLQKFIKISEETGSKLICFNAILKVNDILCSITDLMATPLEILLTRTALEGELETFETFSFSGDCI
jgi:adenylylsulfate kinase